MNETSLRVLPSGILINENSLSESVNLLIDKYSYTQIHERNLQIRIFLLNLKSDYKFPDFNFDELIEYMETLDSVVTEVEFMWTYICS